MTRPNVQAILAVAKHHDMPYAYAAEKVGQGKRYCIMCHEWVPAEQARKHRAKASDNSALCLCENCKTEHGAINASMAGGSRGDRDYRQRQERYNAWTNSTVVSEPSSELGHQLTCLTHGSSFHCLSHGHRNIADYFYMPYKWCKGCAATAQANRGALGELGVLLGF